MNVEYVRGQGSVSSSHQSESLVMARGRPNSWNSWPFARADGHASALYAYIDILGQRGSEGRSMVVADGAADADISDGWLEREFQLSQSYAEGSCGRCTSQVLITVAASLNTTLALRSSHMELTVAYA